MTPQKIKLTRHDGADVCPVAPETLVVVRYKDEDGHFYHAGFAADRNWLNVLAYAVIKLVEPDPVIEVGDVVTVIGAAGEWTVAAAPPDYVIANSINPASIVVSAPKELFTLVRKGGA